jgi:uncharacterized protein YegL
MPDMPTKNDIDNARLIEKPKTIEVAAILDRSGSMADLMNDLVDGFNEMIDKQKEEEGDVYVTVTCFDNHYEVLYEHAELKNVKKLTRKEIFPRGTTALLDAIGKTINVLKAKEQTDKTIVLITTDGKENASIEYGLDKIKELIKEQEEQGWEFIFMGANIDSFAEGGSMGIDSTRTSNFNFNATGVKAMCRTMGDVVSSSRMGKDYNVSDYYTTNLENFEKNDKNDID